MPLTREAKEAVVAEVNTVAASAQSAVAAEYRGLTVAEMTALRAEARNAAVYVRVVKNTRARRAVGSVTPSCSASAAGRSSAPEPFGCLRQ